MLTNLFHHLPFPQQYTALPKDAAVDKDLVSSRKDEIEKLLGGIDGPLIPELYREFVPSRVTHQEFFERLFYYRTQFVSAARLKMQGTLRQTADQEELEGWDDDDDDDLDEDRAAAQSSNSRRTARGDDDENPVSQRDEEVELLKKRVAELERALELCERQRDDLVQQLSKKTAAGPQEDGASTKSWEAVSGEETTGDAPPVNDSGMDWE